jgi:opacity protein-like surface antigen
MKSLIIATAAAAAMAIAAPALAQDQAYPTVTSPQAYMNLGYTGLSPDRRDIGEVTGRAGLRMGKYWGVEGELGTGVNNKTYTNAAGLRTRINEGPAASAYGVVYLPLMNGKLDIFGRGGYGTEQFKTEQANGALTRINTSHSFNYGGGAQYMLTNKDGIRVDYTRRDFQEPTAPKDDNTWSVAYVRKF